MQYYVPLSQLPAPPPFVTRPGPRIQGLLVKAAAGAAALEAPIRRLVVGGRTDLPFLHVRPYSQLLEAQIRPWRMGTMLLALFSGLAVMAAAIGLYAAFAYAVGERRRELAVRMAIGARPAVVSRSSRACGWRSVVRPSSPLRNRQPMDARLSGCLSIRRPRQRHTIMLLIAIVGTLAPASPPRAPSNHAAAAD